MPTSLRAIEPAPPERLIALLRDADEDECRIACAVGDPAHTGWIAADDAGEIGAVLVHWDAAESEIVYIAVTAARRGQGFGRALVEQVIDRAREVGTQRLCVGTANSSLENIAFYQKCGFRMDRVRQDYFAYLPHPVYEHGIRVRDMLVFTLDLQVGSSAD
ncbi:MAG: GNAT family N-acetyltransferase [bacterium]|nr:GNAT family N-acetyltransferase [bacterium]